SNLSFGVARQCKSTGEIGTQFASVVDEIKKQYVVTWESALKGGDKKNHTMQAMVDANGKQAYSNEITDKLEQTHPPLTPEGGSRWWLWVLIAIGGLGLIGLIAWLVMREKPEQVEEPAPAPAPVASAPMPAAGPQKTMALDVSSVGGKMPAVGWIVATSGKHTDQTFKFKPVRTVIGTASDCDIVIEDQFMSSRHCEVRVEANGNYKLVDLGSTNGIVVNDKKVREHELVDNDQFKLGRTEFKFKSIS